MDLDRARPHALCLGQVHEFPAREGFPERALRRRQLGPGTVVLTGAHITGALHLQGSHLDSTGTVALLGNRLVIDDDLLAQQATVDGEFRLAAAQIGGILGLDGATLRNPGGRALNAFSLAIGARFLARKPFRAIGEIGLSDASVGRDVNFNGATLENPTGDALVARGLSGLVYEALDPPLGASRRVAWLRRDIDEYLPQNYETLAAMYRSRGDDASARIVLLARERHRREQLPWAARAWSWLQEVTVGYGTGRCGPAPGWPTSSSPSAGSS